MSMSKAPLTERSSTSQGRTSSHQGASGAATWQSLKRHADLLPLRPHPSYFLSYSRHHHHQQHHHQHQRHRLDDQPPPPYTHSERASSSLPPERSGASIRVSMGGGSGYRDWDRKSGSSNSERERDVVHCLRRERRSMSVSDVDGYNFEKRAHESVKYYDSPGTVSDSDSFLRRSDHGRFQPSNVATMKTPFARVTSDSSFGNGKSPLDSKARTIFYSNKENSDPLGNRHSAGPAKVFLAKPDATVCEKAEPSHPSLCDINMNNLDKYQQNYSDVAPLCESSKRQPVLTLYNVNGVPSVHPALPFYIVQKRIDDIVDTVYSSTSGVAVTSSCNSSLASRSHPTTAERGMVETVQTTSSLKYDPKNMDNTTNTKSVLKVKDETTSGSDWCQANNRPSNHILTEKEEAEKPLKPLDWKTDHPTEAQQHVHSQHGTEVGEKIKLRSPSPCHIDSHDSSSAAQACSMTCQARDITSDFRNCVTRKVYDNPNPMSASRPSPQNAKPTLLKSPPPKHLARKRFFSSVKCEEEGTGNDLLYRNRESESTVATQYECIKRPKTSNIRIENLSASESEFEHISSRANEVEMPFMPSQRIKKFQSQPVFNLETSLYDPFKGGMLDFHAKIEADCHKGTTSSSPERTESFIQGRQAVMEESYAVAQMLCRAAADPQSNMCAETPSSHFDSFTTNGRRYRHSLLESSTPGLPHSFLYGSDDNYLLRPGPDFKQSLGEHHHHGQTSLDNSHLLHQHTSQEINSLPAYMALNKHAGFSEPPVELRSRSDCHSQCNVPVTGVPSGSQREIAQKASSCGQPKTVEGLLSVQASSGQSAIVSQPASGRDLPSSQPNFLQDFRLQPPTQDQSSPHLGTVPGPLDLKPRSVQDEVFSGPAITSCHEQFNPFGCEGLLVPVKGRPIRPTPRYLCAQIKDSNSSCTHQREAKLFISGHQTEGLRAGTHVFRAGIDIKESFKAHKELQGTDTKPPVMTYPVPPLR